LTGLASSAYRQSAQQLALMSPIQGSHYLREKLTQKALIMKAPASVVSNIKAWNLIFGALRRPPMVALEPDQLALVQAPLM